MKASTGLALAAYFGLSSAAAIGDRNAKVFEKRSDSCVCAEGETQGTSIMTVTQWATSTLSSTETVTSYIPSTSSAADPASFSSAPISSAPVATGGASTSGGVVYVTDVVSETVTTCPVGHTLTNGGSTTVLTAPSVITSSYSTQSTITASSPVADPSAAAAESSGPATSSSDPSPASVTSGPVTVTLYSTELTTITSCAPGVTNCPASVSTSLIPTGITTRNGAVAATPSSDPSSLVSAYGLSAGVAAPSIASASLVAGVAAPSGSLPSGSVAAAAGVGHIASAAVSAGVTPTNGLSVDATESAGLGGLIGEDAGVSAGLSPSGTLSLGVDADVDVAGLDVSLGLNASVNVFETITILAETIHTFTSQINSTVSSITGTATAEEIALVKKDIKILIVLIKEAKTHIAGLAALTGHTAQELATILSQLLLEIEFTVAYAIKVIGIGALRTVVASLATICFSLVQVVCKIVPEVATLLVDLIKPVVGETVCVLGNVVKGVLNILL